MQTEITPEEIRNRAADALVTMDTLFQRAGVNASTFWRWEKGISAPSLLTQRKLGKALDALESDKAA